MAPNFMEALNTKAEDIKRPPLLPVGTYRAQVTKIPEVVDEHERYQYVDFLLKLVAPESVDDDELREYGGLSNKTIRHRFLVDKEDEAAFKRAEYQIKRFLVDHLQVDAGDGATLKTLLDSAPGHSCLVQINRRTDKQDSEIQYENILRTAPVE